MRVVGAGVGRTGTLSLKHALEILLGGPCYHMMEIFEQPEHIPAWHAAVRGDMPDWRRLLAGYAAAVDWPAAAFWSELAEAFPDALVLLSVREPEEWWQSADATILPTLRQPIEGGPPFMAEWHAMVRDMYAHRFSEALDDRDLAIARFVRHNDEVRQRVPAERLLEWRPGDGWEPLCAALDLPVPDVPFPHRNTREEFHTRIGAVH